MRVVLLASLTVGLATGLAPAAQSDTLPPCPRDVLALGAEEPGYARLAQGYGLTLTDDSLEGATFTNVAVTLTPSDETPATTRTVPFDPYATEVRVVLQAPSDGEDFTVSVDWDQDADGPSACHGHKQWTNPLVPVRAKVGDPFTGRLSGRYKTRYRPLDYSAKPYENAWRVTALCDYFACSGRLRSNGGLRGKLRYIGKRSIAYQIKAATGRSTDSCTVTRQTVNNFTGEVLSEHSHTIQRAFLGTIIVNLRVTRTLDGRAVTLVGKDTYIERPTPAARRQGCHRTFRYHDAVRVRAN